MSEEYNFDGLMVESSKVNRICSFYLFKYTTICRCRRGRGWNSKNFDELNSSSFEWQKRQRHLLNHMICIFPVYDCIFWRSIQHCSHLLLYCVFQQQSNQAKYISKSILYGLLIHRSASFTFEGIFKLAILILRSGCKFLLDFNTQKHNSYKNYLVSIRQ